MGTDEESVRFILAVVVAVVGLLFFSGLLCFGRRLFGIARERRFFAETFYYLRHVLPNRTSRGWMDGMLSAYESYLNKRNDFWEYFGQVSLAILIVVVLAILLLTKVISAEAGLPILSAVAGFAIAKTASSQSTRRGAPSERDEQ